MHEEFKTNASPLVSAIIPAYNSGTALIEAVESVLAQTYPNIEIIVVDDGSSDDTEAAMKQYHDRLTYIRQPNRGSAAARNRGIENARGELLAFLDADDTWRPEKIQLQVDYLQAHPEIGILCSDAREFNAAGTFAESFLAQFGPIEVEGYVFESIARTAFVLTSTSVIRRVVVEDGLRFNEELRNFQDIDFFMRANLRYSLGLIREVFVDRRLHEGNVSKNFYKRYFYRTIAFEKILSDGTPLTRRQRKTIVRLLAFSCSKIGGWHWGEFELEQSRRWYLKAIRPDFVGIDALLHVLLSFFPAQFIAFLRLLKRGPAEDAATAIPGD